MHDVDISSSSSEQSSGSGTRNEEGRVVVEVGVSGGGDAVVLDEGQGVEGTAVEEEEQQEGGENPDSITAKMQALRGRLSRMAGSSNYQLFEERSSSPPASTAAAAAAATTPDGKAGGVIEVLTPGGGRGRGPNSVPGRGWNAGSDRRASSVGGGQGGGGGGWAVEEGDEDSEGSEIAYSGGGGAERTVARGGARGGGKGKEADDDADEGYTAGESRGDAVVGGAVVDESCVVWGRRNRKVEVADGPVQRSKDGLELLGGFRPLAPPLALLFVRF